MKKFKLLLPLFFVLPAQLFASELNGSDTAWILTSSALVLFMTIPGLALFYGGLVRSQNVLSILIQCFAICCLVSLIWILYGYSLAFFGDGLFIGNFEAAFLNNLTRESLSGSIPESLWIIFQMTFAIITPALIVGAFAERMKFISMMLFTLLWITFVYIPACHMVWGGGYLSQIGVIDFAGGLVVHATCGVAALVGALMLGKRAGFPSASLMPHNRPMVVMGAAMLWVGWFGFNGGSALAANSDAAMAILVTHISAAVGALTWMVIEWIKSGKPTVIGIATGMVAGLATITPASGTVGPQGALVIGLFAGIVCFYATQFIKGSLRIDDSLDVFPVHGIGGILGIILLAPLGDPTGLFGNGATGFDNSLFNQLKAQLIGVLVIVSWTAVFTWLALKITGKVVGLRVSPEDEYNGLDQTEHNETPYISN
ncbi:MAG: ammonium transporter [Gammaproteobacteria bacterium]